jgi:hypothetical protein
MRPSAGIVGKRLRDLHRNQKDAVFDLSAESFYRLRASTKDANLLICVWNGNLSKLSQVILGNEVFFKRGKKKTLHRTTLNRRQADKKLICKIEKSLL